MREILFRGKRTNNGEWTYGYLLQDQYIARGDYIFVMTDGDVVIDEYIDKVIPETVGQYTGLKDKNGTKIFEGDICELQKREICKITFIGGCFSFFNVKFGNIPLNDTEFGVVEYDSRIGITNRATDIEVIGNIHDNPELLEVEL